MVNAVIIKLRILQDIGQDIKRPRHVLIHDSSIVCSFLSWRVGIEIASYILNLLLQVPRGPLLHPIEYHMLQEMCRVVGLIVLESWPGIDPNIEGGSLRSQVWFRGDTEAVRQGGYAGPRSQKDLSVVC